MRGSILTLIVLAIMAREARAQDSTAARWPEPGSRVRVWTSANRRVTGDLINVRGDTLVIRTKGELPPLMRQIPVEKVELVPGSIVTRIEVSRGRGFKVERVVAGAALGAAAAVAVAAVGDVTAELMFGGWADFPVDYGNAAATGAVAGAVLGAVSPGDHWEEAERTPPPVTFAPARGRSRLRLTPTFR